MVETSAPPLLCSVCGTSEFQLVRTEEFATTVFLDTARNLVRGPILSDEPNHVDQVWTCVAGHFPKWEQLGALVRRIDTDLQL
jgi:hypothetical protein